MDWFLVKGLAEVIAPISNIALVYIAFAVFKLERRVTRLELEQYVERKEKARTSRA